MTYRPETRVDAFEQEHPPLAGDLSVGDQSPTLVVHDVGITDFVRYAGAAGDFNPIHHDRESVSNEYDDVIMMGMLGAGYLSTVVSRWLGHGSVNVFRVDFENVVRPDETLTAVATVTEVDGPSVTCDLELTDSDGRVVTSGHAEGALPSTNQLRRE